MTLPQTLRSLGDPYGAVASTYPTAADAMRGAALYIDALKAQVERLKAQVRAYEVLEERNVPKPYTRAPKYDEENYREQMKDAERGHLLR